MSFAAYSKREFNRQTFQDYNLGGSSFSDNFYNKKHIILTIILTLNWTQLFLARTNKLICQSNASIHFDVLTLFIQWSGISVESVYLREV